MGSGNYESQILEAIQILVDDAVSKANYDKTIQGTISRCIDATIGKYIVRYQDSSFYAYSHNTETTYPAGTSVYVLVPGNDMSNEKSIIGTVDHLGPDYVSIIEGENGYEVTGVNTINADGTFGLCSYKKEDLKILYDRDNNVDLIGLDVFGFENYIKKSNSIICGATFKTALDSAQKYRGDYGIVFHLDFTDKSSGEVVTKSYIVNVDQMTGNPYNYTVASRQYGIFDVDGANFISVKQIYLFAYDFPNTAEGKENDIFVSKVELSAANALDKEAAATCALTFVTPQGTYFDEKDLDIDTRTLQAQIRIKGNAIDNDSQNVDYYWFRENNNITTKSEKYNKYGGSGWECLNNYSIIQSETEDNEATVQWTRSNYQYITKKADNVARETTYKCVAVYFDGTILSKTIVIYNYSSNYEISIKSDSGVAFNYDLGKPTLTCYVNGQEETSDSYSYVWSVINSSNQFSVLKETTTENEEYSNAVAQRDAILAKISAEQLLTAADSENLSLYNQIIDQYEYIMRVENNKIHNLKISSITNFSTYKCSVYKSGVFIGTASIIITNTEEANPNYTLIIDNGNQIFKYNEKGISPANGSNQTPQVIEPISFTLYDEKGQKINHNVIKNIEWKVPSSDTLLDVSLTHGNGTKNEDGTKSYFNDPELNILIAPNYNAHYDKNEIQLILTYNDKVISAKTNFTFVKEGESGTNGTDFVCKIIPNGIEGAVVPKYPTVIYNEYTQQYTLNYTPKDVDTWFKVQLWHDGELIFEGTQTGNTIENKEAKVQWMMLQNVYSKEVKDDSNFTINKDTAAITFDTTEYSNPANIIKAVVRYNNVDYYATLPISIIRVANENYDIQLLDTSGFRHVMYTTDGQSPAFDNQPFELIVSQIVEGIKNDISQFSNSEFAVDYNWEVKGSVYYSDWQSELNLIENSLYKTKEKRNQKYFKPIDTYNGLCVTNALVCNITRGEEKEKIASIHIPIHFYINRYGNAAMNGWDGNSISLDEEGGIILAPQVGAGTKNDDNTFTGVFMGSVKEPGAKKEEHGLFGYNAGQRTITLNSEDGSARFGKAGAGQIVINPSTGEALLTSGNYDEEAGTGMEINLSEPSIKFGSGKFSIDKDGNVVADSFATREQVEDLENSISYFVVTTNADSILIPSTADQKPLETKDYTITFNGKFKGQTVTSFSETLISGLDSGIITSFGDNRITFSVDNTKVIKNAVNTYTIELTYTDLTTLTTYTTTKDITVGLAIQGKDGYQGSDGKSAYQIWLDAGNIGTEEDYLNSLKGADGDPGKDGEKGADGRGIESTEVTYQVSSSGTTAPTGAWGTSIPSVAAGLYLWTRTIITYTDNTTSTSYSVGKMGDTGAAGADGTSITIKSTSVTYQAGSSGTIAPTGTWSSSVPSISNGQYLWTKTIVTYSDNTSTTAYSVSYKGIDGTNGTNGTDGKDGTSVTISSKSVTYQASSSGTTAPTGTWSTTIPSVTTGQYLWTKTVVTYSTGDSTTSYSVGYQGTNGTNGTSVTVSSTSTTYQTSSSPTTVPTGTWSSSVVATTTTNKYLWTRVIVTFSDGKKATSYSVSSTMDSITVGGRNLILNSKLILLNGSDTDNRNCSIIENDYVKIIPNKNGNVYNTAAVVTSEDRLKGVQYTISFEILSPTTIGFYWYPSENYTKNNYIPANEQWQKIVFTYIQTGDDSPNSLAKLFGFNNLIAGQTYKYRKLKLEIGNTASDWTPAPEDMEAEMEDLIISTENQFCIGESSVTPPAEDNTGWTTGLIISNINTNEYLWSRIKNTTKSGNVFYSEYSCLVYAQKELINQETEYILSKDDQIQPANNATYIDNQSATKTWSTSKPTENVNAYPYLWSRLHSTFKYTGATVESIVETYQDYSVDTSWNQLFSLTNELQKSIASILEDIMGGYVHIEGGSILIGDDEDNPTKLIIMNHNGIAFFDNPDGVWPGAEKIESATSTWSIDGTLNMENINVINLTATDIENQNLVLGNNNENGASVTGDLDIYDRQGHIMFETVLDTNKNYIEGFKIYKYNISGTTVTPNGYIYLSRENGFREYTAGGNNLIFGNNGNEQFASITNQTTQQVITNQLPKEAKGDTHFGIQIVPMTVNNTGDGKTHTGIAFLKY